MKLYGFLVLIMLQFQQVKVTNALKDEGIDKHELGREGFLKELGNGRRNTAEQLQAS